MFPFVFEWHWDAAHLVFHGSHWCVLSILALGLGYCVVRALRDTFLKR